MRNVFAFILALTIFLLMVGCQGQGASKDDDYTTFTTYVTGENSTSTSTDTGEAVNSTTKTETASTTVPENKPLVIKMSFTGDMMLAAYKNQTKSGNFNDYANKNSPDYFLANVRSIFEQDDFTICNLENVFTDRELKPIYKDYSPAYWFCSKTSNAQILTTSSVEGVSLSNNHIGDYGQEGREDTIQAVEDAGLQYGLDSKIMYFEKDGFRIAVICHGLWSEGQANNIIKLIKKAEQESDYQIVFYHGGKEKIHEPEEWKVRASRKLVDAGADLVIGNHPHVLQPREVYNGVEIVYSLGNFCYGGHQQPENRTVIYQVAISVNEQRTAVNTISSIIPCYVYTTRLNNFQPTPIEEEHVKQKVLDFMDGLSETPI